VSEGDAQLLGPHLKPRTAPLFSAGLAVAGALLVGVLALAFVVRPALAGHDALASSNFEIETNANLTVEHDPPGLDWRNVAAEAIEDSPSGSGDDAFGKGTKEDTEVPELVSGSVPPNKSDLTDFGVYVEENAAGSFLHMFWARVQEPVGTTNMDFEFSQSSVMSANGVTPVRVAGDMLVVYELSKGGTAPELSLLTWQDGLAPFDNSCEASTSFPCWGERTDLTLAGAAVGSINTTTILADDAKVDFLSQNIELGELSPRTFGEASIDISFLLDSTTCTAFGSVYLKSRSSDSFPSALKDFIAPIPIDINNCGSITIVKDTVADGPQDFAFTGTGPNAYAFGGGFSLDDDADETLPNSMTFTNLVPGAYSVTEATESGWDLTALSCTPSSGSTGSQDGANPKADITLAAGGSVTCTFTNTELHKVIVIVCHSGTLTLAASGVTLNGEGTMSTLGAEDLVAPFTEALLCGLDGFDGLSHPLAAPSAFTSDDGITLTVDLAAGGHE
jgi:hypothetical protein